MTVTRQQVFKYVRENLGLILIFIFIVVITHLDGYAAMVIGEVTLVWASIRLLKTLIWSLSWLNRRSSEKIEHIKKSGARFVYMAILCAMSWQGIPYIHHKISKDFAPLIERLEAYKAEHEEYPKTKEAFATLVPHLPKCGILPFSYSFYSGDGNIYSCNGKLECFVSQNPHVAKDDKTGDFYDLTCMTYGFNHHSYYSNSQKWSDGD